MHDVALAVALAVAAEAEVLGGDQLRPLGCAVPGALLLTLPLALRRRVPLLVLAAVMGSFVIQHWLGVPIGNHDLVSVIAGVSAIYSAGAYLTIRRAAAGLVLAYLSLAISVARNGPGGYLWVGVISGGSWLAGRGIRVYRDQARQLSVIARALELEREEKARTAVAEERARIARELHDVVAHSVSVMVVQAGAAEQVLGEQDARAAEPLRCIQRTGRQTLIELRRLLGVLREDTDVPSLAPQPGLGQLQALTTQLAESGVPVTVTIEGQCVALAPGLDLTAYRIVQEALTNVLKHARASRANVTIRYRHDEVELEIIDDGTGYQMGGVNGAGHGLIGMGERASIYGGVLEAGPRPGGGFMVRAALPIVASS